MTKIFSYLFILFVSLQSLGQSVEVKSFVNKNKVGVNEVFSFEITTNSNCQIQRPNFNGLQVLQGPFQSNSSRTLNINGKRTVEREYKISYRLRALKEGTYTIDPVYMTCGGQPYQTKKITVTVTKSGNGSVNVPNNANSDFFIRMHASKTKVYQGEPFTLSLKMYSKNQPQNLENIEFGDSKSIWRKDLNPNQTNFSSDMEIINGMRYYTTTIHSELCFAQTSGELSIEPGYVSAIFRRGFFSSYRREAHSNKVKISVKPLPGNAPKNFNGLVGRFDLEHDISKTTLKPGEAIDLKLKISGSGNMNTFDDPALEIPNDFEQYDPEVKNNLSYKSGGINGSISYNYVLVPTFYGDYIIPSYSFSYFDLESKTYKTLSTGDFNITVLKTENSIAKGQGSSDNKKEVDVQNEDIHYLLKNQSGLFKYDDFLISKAAYIFLVSFPFLVLGGLYLIRQKRGTLAHQNALADRAMKKQLGKNLDLAKSHIKEGNEKAALGILSETLKSFTQKKLGLTTAEMTLSSVVNMLSKKEIDTETVNTYQSTWQTVEMYQYAPIPASKVDELIVTIEGLITNLDKKL